MKGFIEFLKGRFVLPLAFGYLVKLVLHFGRECVADITAEIILKKS